MRLSATIAKGALGDAFAAKSSGANADGGEQRGFDLLADDRLLAAVLDSPVAVYTSEKLD